MKWLNSTCLSVLNETETLFNQKSRAHKNRSKILISHDNHLPVTYLAQMEFPNVYILYIHFYACIFKNYMYHDSVHSQLTFEVEFFGSKEAKCQFL